LRDTAQLMTAADMKRASSPRTSRSESRARTTTQAKASPATVGRGGPETFRHPGAQHSGLSDQARARLEEMIVSLELAPGSIWSEAELSARLGIGRTPVREALQRLEDDHLVRILPRHGAQITEINVVEQLLLLELRRALDRLIAADAARRCTAQERSQLLKMAERLEAFESDDVLAYLRQHYELKNFLADCARNPFVARAVMPCYAMSRRFYYLYYRQVPDIATATKHHAEVIRAVVVGDEKAAGAASDRLMDYVEELTRATVSSRF
jgi:DNA-binding GntR family transcriptional regulator